MSPETARRGVAVSGPVWLLIGGLLTLGASCLADDSRPAKTSWRDTTGEQIAPAAGEDCAVIHDASRHRMVLFGGKTDEESVVNETWELDLATGQWKNVTPPGLNPPPLEDHVLIYDPVGDRMILHGGESGAGTTNGTWSLDLEHLSWRELPEAGAPRREDHTAVYDSKRKRMVLYGGRDDDQVNLRNLDTLDLDPESPTFEHWSPIEVSGKKQPPGRVDHVAIYDPDRDRMVIFSGWDKELDRFFDDTWSLDLADTTWRQHAKKVKRPKPPARRHATAVYDARNRWMIITGGTIGGLLNDVWAFELATDRWINITPGPQGRMQHVAVFDSENRRMVLYGGEVEKNAPKLHDVWRLSLVEDEPQK